MLYDIGPKNAPLFTIEELACSHCGLGKLAPGFAHALRILRIRLDEPMVVNSACRCKEYNDMPRNEGGVDGHPRSLHVFDYPHHPTEGCCAIDIRTYSSPPGYRDRLIEEARRLGWSIGFGKTFLHLDRRTDYTALPRAEFYY